VTAVAVVGLGAMGSRMARRFLEHGHELTVWNRDATKAEPLLGAGAWAAATPAEAARRAEAVVTMVADPQALAAVTEGSYGIAAGLAPGSTLIQMSTVGLEAMERLSSVVPPESLLDAPVLGSISEVEAGTLQVFASGPSDLVERWTPLLSGLGTVMPVGAFGAGTAAKLVANSTLLGVMGVLGETLALAGALGLSSDVAFGVLSATPLAAQAERRRAALEADDYPLRFLLSLARKDADLILEAAVAKGADLRLLEAARSWLADAERHGRGDEDYSALLAEIAASRRTT
jgi:3-hydroxyisobutyrate dehydrogenase-like beta-hydroxyacid dehydrogenase